MKKFVRVELKPESEKEYDAQLKQNRLPEVYGNLLRLLSQVIDSAIAGDNTYCTLGATKEKTAVVLTVITPEGRQSIYASSLGELGLRADELL